VNSDTTVLTQMLREGYNMSKIVFGFSHWSVKYTPLEFVVCWNNLPLVLFLLEKGVNPNVGRKNPLIISIKRGFYQISEKLIILGANTCKPDKNGKTPLYWAVVLFRFRFQFHFRFSFVSFAVSLEFSL
jgi:ankyrin repeat protein